MNAYQSVSDFEAALCKYTGAPYCVAVDSCSSALFLACLYHNFKEITLPKYTYPSAACAVVNSGGRVNFEDSDWQKDGYYRFKHSPIIDSAKYLCRGMYNKLFYTDTVCLSFHGKKALPIGRGGAILTNDDITHLWLKRARFDGRSEAPLHEDKLIMAGWHMIMTPEQASRGLELMQWIKDVNILPPDPYQDLSVYKFFREANR